jgi:1-phosphofructokinase
MTPKHLITVGLNPAIDCVLHCSGFQPGRVNVGRQLARIAAGKAGNVTRALALLGQDVLALGFLGDCDWSFFKEKLHKIGPGAVACKFNLLSQATRQNITVLDGDVETHIRLKGFEVTARDIASLENILKETVREGDAVIFSGSLPEGLAPQQFGVLLDATLAQGAKVAVDTTGPALAVALGKRLWIAKPNTEELAEAWGIGELQTVSAIKAAAQQRSGAVENLVVSRGGLGAVLVRSDGCLSGSVPTEDPIIRTVSCGDHLLAGFVHGLWHGKAPAQALAEGLALATARAVSEDLEIFDSGKFSRLLPQATVAQV